MGTRGQDTIPKATEGDPRHDLKGETRVSSNTKCKVQASTVWSMEHTTMQAVYMHSGDGCKQ